MLCLGLIKGLSLPRFELTAQGSVLMFKVECKDQLDIQAPLSVLEFEPTTY